MKKIISVLTLASLLLPVVALAAVAAPTQCKLVADMNDINDACDLGAVVNIDTYGTCCLINTFYVVTNWLFAIIMVIVGLMIIWGAFQIITAGGEPDKVNRGRSYILYAFAGMVVAWFAKAIPGIAKMMLGGV